VDEKVLAPPPPRRNHASLRCPEYAASGRGKPRERPGKEAGAPLRMINCT
jgi:hypothetical protein